MNYYEIAKTLMQIERNHHEDMFSWIEDIVTSADEQRDCIADIMINNVNEMRY